MDWNFGHLILWKGQGAILGIAESLVVRGQFLPHIHKGEIHELASSGAAGCFRGGNEQRAKSPSAADRDGQLNNPK
jgi:hypothetical protein